MLSAPGVKKSGDATLFDYLIIPTGNCGKGQAVLEPFAASPSHRQANTSSIHARLLQCLCNH
jgi:hypothetical protein